jgi:ribosomal protein S12 methylthiotransferase
MNKVALISLGCAKNLVDSEVMLGFLSQSGYTFVSQPEEADIIIVNTCGFIQPAKQEAEEYLQLAEDLKTKRKDRRIFAAGCYVERNQKELKTKFPKIDEWIGVKDFDKIVPIIEGEKYKPSRHTFLCDHITPRVLSTPAGWAYLKISEGCSHACSFCAIPAIKGEYRSRSVSSIVSEAERLASQGVREVNLISHDSTHYGRDLGLKDGLVKLLEQLINIRPLSWIRILYGYPEEVGDSLLDIMQEEKICSYLDVPFQHSHPDIIKRMRRGLDGDRALNAIHKIRKKIPDIALRTSLIVGFPGEGQPEFDNLHRFVKEAEFDHLGVFTYSCEQDTDAFPWGDPVEPDTKIRRKEILMNTQADISYNKNTKYLGRILDVLIEGDHDTDKNMHIGRGIFQAPEVDGVIYVTSKERSGHRLNTVQKVEIDERDVYDLYGAYYK